MAHRIVLLIGGFDPSGSAGVLLDSAVARALGCYPVSALTAITAQNSLGLQHVRPVDGEMLRKQLETLLDDLTPDAVKIGMVYSSSNAEVISECLRELNVPIVLDTPLRAKNGAPLHEEGFTDALLKALVPIATVVTPNAEEAAVLTGVDVRDVEGAIRAARKLARRGVRAVVVKGGHLKERADVLLYGDEVRVRRGRRFAASPRGTGCAFATSMACFLAFGEDVPASFQKTCAYVEGLVKRAVKIGSGHEFLTP